MIDITSGPAIEVSNLEKHFGSTRAVDGIDMRVKRGTVFGLLGPNGAGKTTVVRMLATLLKPDGGSARVLGYDVQHDADEVRSRISLTGQFASVDEDLTGRENLVLLARLLGLSREVSRSRSAKLLDAFELSDAADRQVKTYSGGMRRRIDIAAGIIITPEIIFLDEPTTGLDPRSRSQVWSIVRALVAEGTTVLLTTQYLDEADQLADRIAVIDRGRVIAEGTSGDLKARVGTGVLTVRLDDPAQRSEAERFLTKLLAVPVQAGSDPYSLTARISDPDRAADAMSRLAHSGLVVSGFSFGRPSLDEVFLALTGNEADQSTAIEENVS